MPLGAPLTLLPPNSSALQRTLLEQSLTSESLPPYSTRAWATVLPWQYARGRADTHPAGAHAIIRDRLSPVRARAGGPRRAASLPIDARNKLLLFGQGAPSKDTTTAPASKVSYDYFPSLPFAALRWVDTQPIEWPYLVTPSPRGGVLVTSETERLAAGGPTDHWSIVKQQFTQRLSKAHTGLGLVDLSIGGSGPHGAGTTIGLGWYYDDRPATRGWRDLADIGVAAGWTGWTTLWTPETSGNECGNVLTHELGHAMTMAHFTSGTAESWGISEEYPDDGQVASYCCDPDDGSHVGHPWGYDSLRRQISTWYRVSASGTVWANETAGERRGKRDPMNGGEPRNAKTCFPHYTPYHTRKAQRWAQSKPLPLRIDGVASWYQWDEAASAYQRTPPIRSGQPVIDVEVATWSLLGTLANSSAACQIYPPIFTQSAPLFALPSPFAAAGTLPSAYSSARYYLLIEHADGVNETALIASPLVDALDVTTYFFSLNIDARRTPLRVHLMQAAAAYPNIVHEASTVLFTRELSPSQPLATPTVFEYGYGELGGSGGITLERLCEASHSDDCDPVGGQARWPTWRSPPKRSSSSPLMETRRSSLRAQRVDRVPAARDTRGQRHCDPSRGARPA